MRKDVTESVTIGDSSNDHILLIGPVIPYRGGIAQHTTMLHRAMRKEVNCLTISFSRQYPQWLFPGKSDKDEMQADHTEDGVEYLIDSLNPLSWYRALKRVRYFAPRLVIFPWWHVYWAPCFSYLCGQLKKDGIEIVFLCHNATEHESARWKTVVTDFVLSYANRFVVHTSVDQKSLLKRFPGKSVDVHPLPIFDYFPQPTLSLPKRAKLELLFFGFVRPYKGLDILLDAMVQLKTEDVYLSIVGEFWNGENEAVKFITEHGLIDKVEIIARYVTDEETANYFARADVVVLPYQSATGSAVIPLAYHYDKPVIATKVGGLPDVVEDGKTGALIDSGSSSQLVAAIKNILFGVTSFDRNEISIIKTHLTWSGLAKKVVGVYKTNINKHSNTKKMPTQTHAILDNVSRENKAKKILWLINNFRISSFNKVLEVGTGSGYISSFFAKQCGAEVYAVDIADERQITNGFNFQLVQGTVLPFADENFDLIISNHVIEHVGKESDQEHHLGEIFRCLEPGGTLYFAVPNRWRLIEPHYRLPFLSWLPENLASAYVRLFKLGSHYDCNPLSRKQAIVMLQQSGFECLDATLDAIPLVGEIEGGWLLRNITSLPKSFWRLFSVIMPTLIFVCRKPLV